MKSPPQQFSDTDARELTLSFVHGSNGAAEAAGGRA
jgi:hypothetical protein